MIKTKIAAAVGVQVNVVAMDVKYNLTSILTKTSKSTKQKSQSQSEDPDCDENGNPIQHNQ
eukprot:Pgem_evm1s5382